MSKVAQNPLLPAHPATTEQTVDVDTLSRTALAMLHPRQRGRRGKVTDDGKSPVSGLSISSTKENTTWGKSFPLASNNAAHVRFK